jgi:hypothetical protein
MKVEDFIKVVKTGDPLFVAGKSWMSDVIETLTDQQFSHAATFYWDGTVAMVAEESERDGGADPILNAGFRIVPFDAWITQQTGPIYFGVAPKVVHDHPEKVLDLIHWYLGRPADQHYGFGSLLPILVNNWLCRINKNINIPIPSWAEVCSTFSTAVENAAGAGLPSDETPGDLAAKSGPLTLLEV